MANIYVSSGTSFSATISITYPAGSICTVSNYKKTWTAPNTSGSWTFKAHEVGIYTVKAVSESKSKEKEVLITAEGQAATVELMFETILWENGDQNTSITGGFEANDANWVTVDSSNITIIGYRHYFGSGSSMWSYGGNFYTKNKVSKGEYTKLCINITRNTDNSTSNRVWLYAADTAAFTEDNTLAHTAISPTTNAVGTFSLALDNIDNFILGIRVYGFNDKQTVVVNKIWLE